MDAVSWAYHGYIANVHVVDGHTYKVAFIYIYTVYCSVVSRSGSEHG